MQEKIASKEERRAGGEGMRDEGGLAVNNKQYPYEKKKERIVQLATTCRIESRHASPSSELRRARDSRGARGGYTWLNL